MFSVFCHYENDLGNIQYFVQPNINGINLSNGLLSLENILNIVRPYINTDVYTKTTKRNFCKFSGKQRKIRIQIKNNLIEMEYPKPFTDLNWNLFHQYDIKVETIPEFISDWYLKTFLNIRNE